MKLYRQEGQFSPFRISFPALAAQKPMLAHLPEYYGDIWIYSLHNHSTILMQEERMLAIAKSFVLAAGSSFPDGWEELWQRIGSDLTKVSYHISTLELDEISMDDIESLYYRLAKHHMDMWAMSIFIDSFDSDFDRREIDRITAEHDLRDDEVQALLTPRIPSYAAQWEQALDQLRDNTISIDEVWKQFFWYRTNYADFAELTEQFVKTESENAHHSPTISHSDEHDILVKHGLTKNPLETFRMLTEWRDQRKQYNFTGIYGLLRLMREVFKRQNIAPDLVDQLLPTEADRALRGEMPQTILERRESAGVMIRYKEDGAIQISEGSDAKAELDRMQQMLEPEMRDSVSGMVACRGLVRGPARIIRSANSEAAKQMQNGDILITSMTRPEFLPLMRKAAAIVSDEGGISSHAAIFSRELGIPCVIGTKVATRVFHDGDMLEVNANNGVVRKLK